MFLVFYEKKIGLMRITDPERVPRSKSTVLYMLHIGTGVVTGVLIRLKNRYQYIYSGWQGLGAEPCNPQDS